MLLDFDDLHPEPDRLESALSRREGILLSLTAHGAFLLLLLFGPAIVPPPDSVSEVVEAAALEPPPEPLRFVEVVPLPELPPAPREANSLEPFLGDLAGAEASPPPEPPPPAPAEPEAPADPVVPEPRVPEPATGEPAVAEQAVDEGLIPEAAEADVTPAPRRVATDFSDALRDLGRYLPDETRETPDDPRVEQSTQVVFEDTRGVDLRPWWPRVKFQIERNWIMPPSAGVLSGSGLVRLCVLPNGRIVDLTVLQPAEHAAATNSVLNAFKLSNPTAALPAEYPGDRLCMRVTFVYGRGR